MDLFTVSRGQMFVRAGELAISVVETPLMAKILKLLEGGASVLVTGPHGVGKSVALSAAVFKVMEGGGVLVDLTADTSTFAESVRLVQAAGIGVGVFDAVPLQFYLEPEVWSEHAVLWSSSCGKIMARANYLMKRGHPVALVLPRGLAVLCRSELKKFEVVEVGFEREVAKSIFLSNSEVYCGDDYAEEVVGHVERYGEGGYYISFEAARSLRYCDEDPAKLVDRAREAYVGKLSTLLKSLYASTCVKAKRLLPLFSYRHLPSPLLAQVVNYDVVESKVKMIEKLMNILDKVAGPHREYVKILILQNSEELKALMRPRWYVKAAFKERGPLYEEALKRAVKEVEANCGVVSRPLSIRLLVKAFVISHGAYGDLAHAVANLAVGESPCVGKLKKLCKGGTLAEDVVDALLSPRRLSIELPARGVSGLAAYASLEASEVDEKGWLEVLNYLYEASERSRIRVRPFEDYVHEALARGSPITKKLALTVVEAAPDASPSLLTVSLLTALELGENVDTLVVKYVETVGDAQPIYEMCGDRCRDLVVEVAVASARRVVTRDVCGALRQLETALSSVGYRDVVERYRPHEACVESIKTT